MDTPNEINWPESIWQEINHNVIKEVGKVRVAQKIFPTLTFDNNPTQVPDELIDFGNLSIREGATKPFVEIFADFSLTSTQVAQEEQQRTCRTLARMAAKALALAEDTYFFQKSVRSKLRSFDRTSSDVRFPANVSGVNWRTDQDQGLLAEANPDKNDGSAGLSAEEQMTLVTMPIDVYWAPGFYGKGNPGNTNNAQWGERTFEAVVEGITKLVGKGQAPNYALVLPTEVYADTFVAPSNASLVTTADRIKPLVEGGFYNSGVLPSREGLLIALGGEPTKLYVGREATTEFVRKRGANYFFRVVERVQYVVRDPRSLVLLNFRDAESPKKAP